MPHVLNFAVVTIQERILTRLLDIVYLFEQCYKDLLKDVRGLFLTESCTSGYRVNEALIAID